MHATSVSLSGYANAPNRAALRQFFEYPDPGLEDLGGSLEEVQFGEYLVEQGVIDRYQLFRALQMQDRMPGVQIGEAAVALGFASTGAIRQLLGRFQALATIELD